jgi:hypothetical protein
MSERVLHIRGSDIAAVRITCRRCGTLVEQAPTAFAVAREMPCPGGCQKKLRTGTALAIETDPAGALSSVLSKMDSNPDIAVELVIRE